MASLTASRLRIGQRYRAHRLQGPYDALIIGSGLGGLSCASLLSEIGWKVAVFEQHYTAGGYTHSYERAGYEWDVGLHYVGDMGASTLARRCMDHITGGRLQWQAMDSAYDHFFIGAERYTAIAGKDAYRHYLYEHFPQERRAIDRYFRLLDKIGKAMGVYTLTRLLKPGQLRWLLPPLLRLLPDGFRRSTREVLAELTDNSTLIAVLTAQWGDLGLPPSQSAFVMHALIARHYMYGGYYPVGGSWRIAESILPGIRAAGGEVFTYASVERILVEKGRACGLLMADGQRIEAPHIISTAGVSNTFERLLPAAASAPYRQRLQAVTPSCGHIGLYIGLQATAAELQLPRSNMWVYPSTDYEGDLARFQADPQAPWPVVYISFPSAKDPAYLQRHPGTATIEIVAPAPFAWFEAWNGSSWGQRGDDYEAFKARLRDSLLEVLFERLPQLRGRLDYVEVSTPLSSQHFNAYSRGELYGIDHDPRRFAQDWLSARTDLPGLWLSGQDILSCGVVGAMMSGVLTAQALAGRQLWPVLRRILRPQRGMTAS